MLRGFPGDYPNLAIEEKYKLSKHRDTPWGLPGPCALWHPKWQAGTLWGGGPDVTPAKEVHARALRRHLLSSTQVYPVGPWRPQRSGLRVMIPGEGRKERRAAHPADYAVASMGLPGSSVVKNPRFHFKGHGFSSWSGN